MQYVGRTSLLRLAYVAQSLPQIVQWPNLFSRSLTTFTKPTLQHQESFAFVTAAAHFTHSLVQSCYPASHGL